MLLCKRLLNMIGNIRIVKVIVHSLIQKINKIIIEVIVKNNKHNKNHYN